MIVIPQKQDLLLDSFGGASEILFAWMEDVTRQINGGSGGGGITGPGATTSGYILTWNSLDGATVGAGIPQSTFASDAQGAKADSAVQPGDLAAVATSGDYNSLINKPSLGALAAKDAVNNSDWLGDDLDVVNGGTGASTASAARNNLGLGTSAVEDVVTGTGDTTGDHLINISWFNANSGSSGGSFTRLYQNTSTESASVNATAPPGVLVGTPPTLTAATIGVGDTIRLEYQCRAGAPGAINTPYFSIILDDGTSSVTLANLINIDNSGVGSDIDYFRITAEFTRVSSTNIAGYARVERITTALANGATPEIFESPRLSIGGPDFSSDIDILFYGRVSTSNRTYYIDQLTVDKITAA